MYNNQNTQNMPNVGAGAGTNNSGSSNSNRTVVPEAKQALNTMKYEIANELGINLKQGYNGDLPSRQAGYIGGYMVKKMIEQQERQMSGK
ncbi:alpha/beta-type small acid-soluble spore protein [Beduinella massiliensis]|uniref:alpha/beta-type small acid-soluble spore protein n=1 Tax=Beduinella massiliensis TaxID=1852363 RepID=UPI003D15470D